MKVLKFLIKSNYNLIVRNLVDYLIDSGHFVFIYSTNRKINIKWLTEYKHNLYIISKNKLNSQKFDYVIDFDNLISKKDNFIKINFTLNPTSDGFLITSWLEKNENKSIIYQDVKVFNNTSDCLEYKLKHLISEIKEVFIDTIIYLLRFGNKSCIFNNKTYVSTIGKLIYYEQSLEQLNIYYKSLEKENEKIFFIQNLITNNQESIDYAEHKFKINNRKINLDKINLEILTIYFLTLLNSRQEVVYGYEICSAKSENNINTLCKLNKFVSIKLTDSYSTLLDKCNNKLYNIINNDFYNGTMSADKNIRTGIIISYDYEYYEEGYLLFITYNSKDSNLTIRYRKSLYFFSDFKYYLNHFLNKFDKFSSGKVTFKELLDLPQNYLVEYIVNWNNTDKDYPIDKTLHNLFEEQVEKTPNKIAVVCEEIKLTYREINIKANQLANYIRQTTEIKPDTLIVLCLDKSEQMIISILAVLKTGGAYVPIDPTYPDERISYILQETNAKVVLTNKIYKDKLEKVSKKKIGLTKLSHKKISEQVKIFAIDSSKLQKKLIIQSITNPETKTISTNLAYVIYTSGTTGKPKGVMIEHKGIVNLIQDLSIRYKIRSDDNDEVILQASNYIFDASIKNIALSILNGCTLVVPTSLLWVDSKEFCNYLNIYKITYIDATPTFLGQYDLSNAFTLRRLIIGGEKVSKNFYNQLKLTNNLIVMNSYGPTEVSVTTIVNHIQGGNLAIGRPISNIKGYILDAQLNPLPIGVIGELYIGGVGLARGYLNKPELTVERFIANPFQTREEQNRNNNLRLYKTGDLVYCLPDGNLEYVGRNDFQVKIRGYRIELGEIETALSSYAGIRQSIVLAKDHTNENGELTGNKYLVGYYLTDDNYDKDNELEKEKILSYLHTKLPDYMVPVVLMNIPSLPLTLNGKLDIKALPIPEFTSSDNYVAPRNQLEGKMCKIWAEVLDLSENKVGIQDDFFRLGGDSISLMKLVSKLNNEFQSNVKFKDIFSFKTVKELSMLVEDSIGNSIYKDYLITESDKINLFKPFPLSNVQQAYYFGRFSNFELGNISTHTYSEYKFIYLNIEVLEKAFNKLINRHLAIRTIFINNNQQYLQKVPYYNIKVCELSDEQELISIRKQLSHKVYNPETYPLFDIIISKFSNSYILHVSIDALLMDANSFRVLFTELTKLYNDPSIKLPNLGINYRDYVLQYNNIRNSELFKKHRKYWFDKIGDYNLDINLPMTMDPLEVKKPRFKRITRIISSDIWEKLLNKVKQKSISSTALILAVYGRVLSYWTGQDRICINLTLFNRLPLHKQIDMIIGDFTVLELFNYSDNIENNVTQSLKNIHEELWNDIEHNLFDGIDFQRLIRTQKSIPNNKALAPIVLTSILGNKSKDQDVLVDSEVFIDESYRGVNYSSNQTSQAWLDNQVYEVNQGLVVRWDYVEQLFEQEVIVAMHDSYCKLIEALADINWDTEFIPLITIPNKDKELIELTNSNKQELSICIDNERISTLFDKFNNIAKIPHLENNIAVIDTATSKEKEYSYKQLLQESNSLGQYLLITGNILNTSEINNEDKSQLIYSRAKLIGVLSEKGYNQVVSILSIMKSGHGYLPLSIDWPVARLEELLEQGNVKTLLISKAQYNRKQIREYLSKNYQLLIIEDVLLEISNNKQLKSQLIKTELPIVTENNIAYVIFTSGSTGKPKGVTISHNGALNTINAVNSRFNVSNQDRILALSDLSFDLSVYDIFGILSTGGVIVFPSQDKIKEPSYWIELIEKYKITIWNTVPQLAGLLIDEVAIVNFNAKSLNIKNLRLFLLSGDWIPTNLPDRIKKHYPNVVVISLGGATECSIWSIWYEINSIKKEWSSIPYGFPMPNQNIYILNHTNEHCPIGVIGEIHIGGIGVALNYFEDQKKTDKSFINHRKFGRLYKTGDLGRWNSIGYVEFIGRKDNQVKLNGYRVELGEIVAKLIKLEEIEEAIVKIQKEENQDYLVGYLLLNKYGKKQYRECEVSTNLRETINKVLCKSLPEYMLPYDYIVLDAIPLSSNGKLEVNKLPVLQIQDCVTYTAPRNEIENRICKIYAEVLHLANDKVGIRDNFFRLGGNSLLAMQLISKINRELGINLKLNDLYNYKTIKDISDNLCVDDVLSSSEVGII